jgi:azurin
MPGMKLRTGIAAGLTALSAAALLASPAYAASPPALKADKCALHVNVPHPVAGDTETLTVASTAAGTTVRVKISYKTVGHTWTFKTPAGKVAAYKFKVGRPTPEYKVKLAGTVTAAPKGYKAGAVCGTSFVPERA